MEAHSASAVANFFIGKGLSENDNLTLMKLNKLIYIAHGMHLAAYGRSLINEPVQAWKFGPVVNSVYHQLKHYGMSTIDAPIINFEFESGKLVEKTFQIDRNDKNTLDLLQHVWDRYKKYNGFQLSNWTHLPESPWYQTWVNDGGNMEIEKPIPNDLIKEYFLGMGQKAG